MPKKESSNKAREWERDRRERLNETFNLLSTLLPSYDPSTTRSKIEILQKAVSYISDLQKENRELVKGGKDQAWKQVRQLKHRVENLVRRVQQLARLLLDAGISIPPELPKDGQPPLRGRPPKWSNKIRQEDATALLEKVKNKRAEKKKKERTPLNVCGNKVISNETKAASVVSTSAESSNIKTVSTTSKTKLSKVTKNTKKVSKERGKKSDKGRKPGCEELPTVTQLLGLSLNDIDVSPTAVPPPHLPGSGELISNNLNGVTSNTSGTNVTVLASNIPQVPQGFIVIPKANSLPTTSKGQLPQSPCIVVAPATQACSPQNQQPCVVMPSKVQATKVIKTSMPVQQVPMVLSSTTSALENIVNQTVQKSDSAVVVTNSHLLTTPIMATGMQTCSTPTLLPTQGASLTGLGPGTLILANGSILPIFPSPQPAPAGPRLITPRNSTQIVMNSGSNIPAPVLPNQPVLLVQNKAHSTSDVNSSNVKPRRVYSLCLPKPLKRKGVDSTRTNKVPISALTPRSQLIRSIATSVQVPVNKHVNKLGDTRSSKRIPDKKTNNIQKGTGRGSKANAKIHNKKKITNIQEKIENNLQPSIEKCVGKIVESKISETLSTDSTRAKENVNELSHDSNNAAEIQVNCSVTHEILNNISTIIQKCEKDDLSGRDCHKRKRDTNEEITLKGSKQVKCSHQSDNAINIHPSTSHGATYTTTGTIPVQDSLTCISANGQTKKPNEDSEKTFGGNDNYSIDAICKSNEKNDHTTDMIRIDSTSTEPSSEESAETSASSPSKTNCDSSVVNNNDAAVPCDTSKLCPTVSYSNLPSSVTSPTCLKDDNMLEKQLLNSSNDFNVSSCSSETSLKCPSIGQGEGTEENVQNLYTSTINNDSKNITEKTSDDLKSAADDENCSITAIASVTKTGQNLESSSITNDVFQPETSVTYTQTVTADDNLFPPKAQNEISESKASDVTSLQTEFGSENVPKIQNVISEHSLHDSSHLTNGIANDESPSHGDGVSDLKFPKSNCTVELDSCKVDNRNNIESSENMKEIEKSPKNDFAGNSNVQSELSSTNDYNTYSSVSEGNVGVCSSANKMYRSNENLDLGASASSSLCLSLQNNELSNDLFASLQVPSGGQHAESISPTAAFLLAFPLVSTSKVSDIIGDSQDDVGSDSLQGTSTLLQIGSLDSDHHSEAIISRSPTFHSSNSPTKILSQPTLCQKDSRADHQELECPQFLQSEPSKVDRNSEKTKIDHIKFSESLDEADKTSNKNWMPLQTPAHSETTSKTDNDENSERNLDAQSFTKECLESPMQNREITGECSKEKGLEQSCTFNATKEIRNVDCSSGSLNSESSQQTNSNLPSFTEGQFVPPNYNSKEHIPVSTKQDQTPQTSSALQITPDRSMNFANPSTSKDDERNFRSAYKNLALPSSNSGSLSAGVSFTMGKNVIEQATMTEDVRTSHSNSIQSSNKIKPTNSSFSPADCNDYATTSQGGYLLSNTVENEKCNIPSFSVAHNSSNFSILSWTTLSPTSTMTNTSQYDGFGTQNSVSNQNSYLPVPKKQNKNNCSADACSVMTSSVPGTCPAQMKETEQVSTLTAHNKFSESHSSSVLQNTDNQTYLQHYLTDQRKMPHSITPTSINNVASQGPQLCVSGKVTDSEQQHRPPVNWMTTPDVRGGQHSMSVIPSNSVGNRTLPSSSGNESGVSVHAVTSKDNQYCSISSSQNVFISCISSTLPTFDTRTYTNNTFYGTQSVSSQNSQSNCYQSRSHGQGLTGNSNHNSNKFHFTSPLNRISDVHMGQTQVNEAYSVPWLQKKPNPSSVCSTESSSSNYISSSLPTLVGDLALGTNYPLSVNDDDQGNKSTSVNFHAKMPEKKNICNPGNNLLEVHSKQIQTLSKTNDHNKDRGTIRNSVQEFRNTSSQSSSSSFLSVSQLVNQAHPCESSAREHIVSRESSHISHRVVLPNKNTSHSQSHQLPNLSSTLEESKEQISSLNSSDKEMNRKPRPEIDQSCVSVRAFESRISLPHSREEEARKLESSQVRGNNHYIQEITSSVASSHSSSSNTFSVPTSTQASSSTLSNVSWPSGNVAKQRNVKGSSSGCKAPASSYSAEALIGLNPPVTDRSSGATSDSRGNKVITLPPPVVTERFCRHQNYPPSSAARPIQVPPPFSAETILPSNYFSPMELQTSHHDSSSTGPQNVNNSQSNLSSHSHQNPQGFNTFTSSSSQSAVRASSGQCSSVLYSHSDFMSSVGSAHSSHSLPPVSLPCNFLPDLGTNNSYTSGILSDSGNPFLFPSSTISVTRGSSTCHSSGGAKQNLTHLHSSAQVTTGVGSEQASNQVVPTHPLGDKETYSSNSLRCNNGSSTTRRAATSDANLLQQNTVEGGNICNSSKPRIRKRTSESVTPSSSSGLGGLMDLGYLGIPPVIGSPMLPDEGTFINHSGGFLSSGSQHTAPPLYAGAPTPSQGSFYPTPHSHGQSSTSLTASHTSHLPVNSGSFTTQTTRGLQLSNMVSPSVVNSSGTSLTNFNLSTIFPEINEKQVPNNTYNSSGSKETGPLLSSSLPVPPLPTTAPPHPQLNNSSSNHSRQPTTLLLPPVSSYAHRQTSGEASICLPPPPPPPVPLHSSVTFNNLLNSTASQMCQMQWR